MEMNEGINRVVKDVLLGTKEKFGKKGIFHLILISLKSLSLFS